jgi:hypothetical protein
MDAMRCQTFYEIALELKMKNLILSFPLRLQGIIGFLDILTNIYLGCGISSII